MPDESNDVACARISTPFLPDASMLHAWSDHAEPPRALVIVPARIGIEVRRGWPAWIGVVDENGLVVHADEIRTWRPDWVMSLVESSVPVAGGTDACIYAQPRLLLHRSGQITAGLDMTDTLPLWADRHITSSAAVSAWLRHLCSALVGSFFRPGVLCVDLADVHALTATEGVRSGVVTCASLEHAGALSLRLIRERFDSMGFKPRAIHAVITAQPGFSMMDWERAAAAVASEFPNIPVLGPAVPMLETQTRFASLLTLFVLGDAASDRVDRTRHARMNSNHV